MALVITPWALRNHRLGIPVSISTNGSMGFYLTANPKSTATYEDASGTELMRDLGYKGVAVSITRGCEEDWRGCAKTPGDGASLYLRSW